MLNRFNDLDRIECLLIRLCICSLTNRLRLQIYDPYRWLEDPESEETKKFVDAQNSLTTPYINQCAYKSSINERLTKLWNYQKYSCPFKRGENYFFYKNTGLQNQR